jgi:hypothetical protein
MKQEINKTDDKKKFAFDKTNFIILAIGMAVVIIGFLLMTGPSSSETHYESDIFSFRRIKVAPVVCFIGYISIIFAILRRPKDKE